LHGLLLNMRRVVSRIYGALFRGSLGKRVISENRPLAWVDPVSGMRFEIKPTGWEDVNGIIGYFHTPGPTSVTTVRLAEREQATKEHRQVVVSP
ncbi:hypothetical protein ABQ012_13275, partial [Xanthomonas hortorum pv. hederae]